MNIPSTSPWSVPPPLTSVFTVPSPAPEFQLKTVGTRRQPGLVPLKKSVTYGKGKLLMDMALFMGRSFRVGWGPNWMLANSGEQLSGSLELEFLQGSLLSSSLEEPLSFYPLHPFRTLCELHFRAVCCESSIASALSTQGDACDGTRRVYHSLQ